MSAFIVSAFPAFPAVPIVCIVSPVHFLNVSSASARWRCWCFRHVACSPWNFVARSHSSSSVQLKNIAWSQPWSQNSMSPPFSTAFFFSHATYFSFGCFSMDFTITPKPLLSLFDARYSATRAKRGCIEPLWLPTSLPPAQRTIS